MTESDKRKKNDALISFNLEFTNEQKLARKAAHKNILTILTGRPGTAKTTIAASVALEMLFNKNKQIYGNVKKIIVARPNIEAGEPMGFLPGDPAEKLSPYTAPVYSVIEDLIGKPKLEELVAKGVIEVLPIAYMRGHTFKDCAVIVDESQNTTLEQLKLISSRIGWNCKVFMTSDWRQVDLKDRKKSACGWMDKIWELDGVGHFELTENFRHPLAVQIMDELLK